MKAAWRRGSLQAILRRRIMLAESVEFNNLEICLAYTATSKEETSATRTGLNRKCDDRLGQKPCRALVDVVICLRWALNVGCHTIMDQARWTGEVRLIAMARSIALASSSSGIRKWSLTTDIRSLIDGYRVVPIKSGCSLAVLRAYSYQNLERIPIRRGAARDGQIGAILGALQT